MQRRLPSHITRTVLPGPLVWLAVLALAGLGALMLLGAIALASDPEYGAWWPVLTTLVGLAALAVCALLFVTGVAYPRPSAARLAEDSAGSDGIVVTSSRRGDLAALIAIAALVAVFVAGAIAAEGGWRVVLGIVAALTVLAGVGATTAVTRPRYLRITPQGLESAALSSSATATWEALQFARLSMANGGGGQWLARFTLPPGVPGYERTWRNKLELSRTAVDVEFAMTRADGEALVRFIVDLIEQPGLRTRIVVDREVICEALATPATTRRAGHPQDR